MLDSLIFSKDRACQLELLLRSIKDNFNEISSITVLYLATNKDFEKGYEKLKSLYSHCRWIKESDFVQDALMIYDSFKSHFLVNFVDDEVVIGDISVKNALRSLSSDDDIHCVSLRMHEEVNYCYTADLPSIKPVSFKSIDNEMFEWNWRDGDSRTEYGYPSCINSHIYLTQYFKWILNQVNFSGVNNLEGMINLKRNLFRSKMICFNKPKTVNIANNIIQSGVNRSSSKQDFSVDHLNELFMNGYRIDTENLYGYYCNTPTFERDYKMLKWVK